MSRIDHSVVIFASVDVNAHEALISIIMATVYPNNTAPVTTNTISEMFPSKPEIL